VRARRCARPTWVARRCSFDFAGDTIDIFDPITGEAHAMKLFVAAMGASNYTYAEACRSESLPDWISMHIKLFRFLGCQSASDRDPGSASKRDPLVFRFERLAFAPSELVRVAETGRARVDV
jgi:hypothetical protein